MKGEASRPRPFLLPGINTFIRLVNVVAPSLFIGTAGAETGA